MKVVVIVTAVFVMQAGRPLNVVVVITAFDAVIVISFVDLLVDVFDVSLPLKVSPRGIMAER